MARARRRRRRLVALAALLLVALVAATLWAGPRATGPDPYGLGPAAVTLFRQRYGHGWPLTVRVADTSLGWIAECEGIAFLQGEFVAQGVIRRNGTLVLARYGHGQGLWIVDAEVSRGRGGAGPPPSWPQLLPLGPTRPLAGSLRP